jgi:hypothetical protein
MRSAYPPRLWFLVLAIPLPSLILGGMLMHWHGLPSVLWGQNLALGLVLTFTCIAFSILPPVTVVRPYPLIIGAICVGLLAATFANAGLQGVHRWVRVGSWLVHAGAICLPALILALGGRRGTRQVPGPAIVLLGASAMALLALQPDAAQASALAGALFTLWLPNCRRAFSLCLGAAATAALVVLAWVRPDPLPSIQHVEGIVGLAAQNGALWLTAAIAALILLPLPFLLVRLGTDSLKARALGVYFCLGLVAPLWGPFPVPLMGYGLSPVVGYFIALGWLALRLRAGGSAPSLAGGGPAVSSVP